MKTLLGGARQTLPDYESHMNYGSNSEIHGLCPQYFQNAECVLGCAPNKNRLANATNAVPAWMSNNAEFFELRPHIVSLTELNKVCDPALGDAYICNYTPGLF